MSDPIANDRRRALSEARSALGIVHAQYWRALARAAKGGPAERAGALVEARRLGGVAVGCGAASQLRTLTQSHRQ